MRRRKLLYKTESKRYQSQRFIYWWDIGAALWKELRLIGGVIFTEKDTNRLHGVSIEELKKWLTPGRLLNAGPGGAWRIKILADDPNTLRIEEPGKNPQDWKVIPERFPDENS